jgi:hypothetical protein
MTDEARKKYHSIFITRIDPATTEDVSAITRPAPERGQIPYSPASKNTPGFRNHNPET